MYKDIFKKEKRLPGKFKVLLIVLAGMIIIALFIPAVMIWWRRPIVIVRISEFSLSTEAGKLNLEEKSRYPGFSVTTPQIYGSLNIKIENIGKSSVENIALNFLPRFCRLGEISIRKSDADCAVEVISPTELGLGPDSRPKAIAAAPPGYYQINVKELNPGSEVRLRYRVYQKDRQEPVFKFGKMSSSNAKVKVFYYRQ